MVPGHCSTDSLPKYVSSCACCLFAVFAAETNYSSSNSPYDHYFLRSHEMQEASAYAALDERLDSAETAELIITTEA